MKSPRLLLVLGLYLFFAWQVTAADSLGNPANTPSATPNSISKAGTGTGQRQQRLKTQSKRVKRKKGKPAKRAARNAHKPVAPRTPLSN